MSTAAHPPCLDEELSPLGDFVLDESAWDAFEGDDFEQWLLREGEGGVNTKSNQASPNVDANSGATDGSQKQGDDASGASRTKRARTEDSAEEKLERLRNRNRIAQARRRQRQRVCSFPMQLPLWHCAV